MEPGVESGISLLTRSLSVAVRAIRKSHQEIKANKQAAEILANSCESYQEQIARIFDQMQANGLENGPIYDEVQSYANDLLTKLKVIETEMDEWSHLGWWELIRKNRSMARRIAVHQKELLDIWPLYQAHLGSQNLASIAQLGAVVVPTLRRIEEQLSVAQQNDQRAYLDSILSTTRTLEVTRRPSSPSGRLSSPVGLRVLITESVSVSLTDSAGFTGDVDDPDILEARMELIQALKKYEGERPLFTVDTSELTVPIKFYRGENADIYKSIRSGKAVAIKMFSITPSAIKHLYKRINRESKIWRGLCHPNVVPFIGICGPSNAFPFLISEWMPNGNARMYARKKAQKNPPEDVDCIKIAMDVADGLAYLHSRPIPIMHGSVKGSNILIDADGTARITDFSLSSYIDYVSYSRPFPLRWAAPEVLAGEASHWNNIIGDVYSFACAIFEIITDEVPFVSYISVYKLEEAIMDGRIPKFPSSDLAMRRGLSDRECDFWKLLENCWERNPQKRLTAVQARDALKEIWKRRN